MDLRPFATSTVVAFVWLLLQLAKNMLGTSALWLHAALATLFVGSGLVIGRPQELLVKPVGRMGYRITVGYFVATCILYMLTHSHAWQWSLQNHFNHSFSTPELAALFTLVPFYEEFFFRGGLQPWVQRRLEPRTPKFQAWSIYVTALVFWLFHAPASLTAWQTALAQGAVPLSPGPFFLGLVCGFIAQRDGSLLFAVALHGVANLLGPLWADMLPPFLTSLFFSR